MSSTPQLPEKDPIASNERVQVTPMGPEHHQGPAVYLFADVMDEIVRHADYRHDPAATLLVGKHYQGPQGPFVEVQGFAESVYVGRTLDLYEPLRDGYRRQQEALRGNQQVILGWSHSLPGQGVRATAEGYLIHRTFFNRPEQLMLMMDVQRQELAVYRLDEQGRMHNVQLHLISMRGQALPFAHTRDPEELPELDIGDTAVPPTPLPRIDQTSTVRAMPDEDDEGEGPVPVLPSLHGDSSLDSLDSLDDSGDDFPHSQTAIMHAVHSGDEAFEDPSLDVASPSLLRALDEGDSLDDDPLPSRNTAVSYALATSEDEDVASEDEALGLRGAPRGGTLVAHALMDRDEDSLDEPSLEPTTLLNGGTLTGHTLVTHALPGAEEDEADLGAGGDPVIDDLLSGLGKSGEDTSEGWNYLDKKPGSGLGSFKKVPPRRYGGEGKTPFVAREALPTSDSGDEDSAPDKFSLQRRLERIKRLRKIQENSGAPPTQEAHDRGEDDGHDS